MLATLVIGLREGLEATLIVGIIAAFLRRNRVSLAPMWSGVGAAVLLSVAVGFGLQLVERALPQAEQEGMETIIGVVAVVFVTGMIVWMRTHARTLGKDLEASATEALGRGTAWALAGMAFLAVLKEGFETAVFLLATFQASSDTGSAALGAVIGIAAAVLIGYGIYTGGVRLDLSKFFTVTGVFLVFVAAGLVLTAIRHAHEAGWVVIGQQRTVDLSWLAPNGSVQGALVTGVLGIPADPRVIEVLGWVLYLVPVLALSLWPRAWRPAPARVPFVRAVVAGGLAVAAVALAVGVPLAASTPSLPASVRLDGDQTRLTAEVQGASGTVRTSGNGARAEIELPASAHARVGRGGVTADRWRVVDDQAPSTQPSSLTLDDLVGLFGRIPVGISPSTNPGPFTAAWSTTRTTTVWTVAGGVLDATSTERDVLTLSGGGLPSARTTTLDRDVWSVPDAVVERAAQRASSAASRAAELQLWAVWLPLALGIAAVVQVLLARRDHRRATATPASDPDTTPSRGEPAADPMRSPAYAAR